MCRDVVRLLAQEGATSSSPHAPSPMPLPLPPLSACQALAVRHLALTHESQALAQAAKASAPQYLIACAACPAPWEGMGCPAFVLLRTAAWGPEGALHRAAFPGRTANSSGGLAWLLWPFLSPLALQVYTQLLVEVATGRDLRQAVSAAARSVGLDLGEATARRGAAQRVTACLRQRQLGTVGWLAGALAHPAAACPGYRACSLRVRIFLCSTRRPRAAVRLQRHRRGAACVWLRLLHHRLLPQARGWPGAGAGWAVGGLGGAPGGVGKGGWSQGSPAAALPAAPGPTPAAVCCPHSHPSQRAVPGLQARGVV